MLNSIKIAGVGLDQRAGASEDRATMARCGHSIMLLQEGLSSTNSFKLLSWFLVSKVYKTTDQ